MENNEPQKEMTISDLARIIQNDLMEIKTNLNKVQSSVASIETEVKNVKLDTEEIRAELHKKVDKIEHNTLIYRVEKLEKKFA